MSELQIGLLGLGALAVGAVYLYNRLQERRLRRRLEAALGAVPGDALLGRAADSALADGRIEPRLEPGAPPRADAPAQETQQAPAAASPAGAREAAAFDAVLDYIAEIEAPARIPEPALAELLGKIAACGKPARAAGFDPHSGQWRELTRDGDGRPTRLRVALQLANRGGPVHAAQLEMFCDAVRACAERVAGRAVCPDPQAALRSARDLDAFCSAVDVAIGVNIVAPEGTSFSGTKIRSAAEAAGLHLGPDGLFHYRDEAQRTLFTLDNHEPAPFLPEQIANLTTRGVTLLLDVPRVADGPLALGRMLEVARALGAALGGRLVDDNRVELSEAGIARIHEQLRAIHAEMERRGIRPGGARALRLFSG